MENLESMLNGIEKDKSAKGLPSYLTAIPTVPGAGSPGWSSPVWPPSPNSGIPPDGQPPTPTIYQLPRSYPGLPGSISGASPTSPEGRPSIPESAQLNLKIPKREENVPSEKDPKASAAPPSSSRIELDFTSLLKDLQDTHNQLLSARPSSVAASDGDDYHVNVDDYHGSVEDEDDSANLSKEPSRKDIASPSESLSPSGDHGITSDNERYRNQYDEQSDNGSESEASDDSYDDRPLWARRRGGPKKSDVGSKERGETNDRLEATQNPNGNFDLGDGEFDGEDGAHSRLRYLQLENVNYDEQQQEEIEIPDDDDESDDVELALKYPNGVVSSVPEKDGAMQSVTVDDYKDNMAGLEDMLDRYMKKSRYSRMINGTDLSHKTSASLNLQPTPTSATASHRLPVHSSISPNATSPIKHNLKDEPMDDLPLAQLHTLQRRKRSIVPVIEEKEPPPTPSVQTNADKEQMNLILTKLSEANLKKITTRIYIEDAETFETIVLTSLMTADQVVADLVNNSKKVEQSADWTLFELANDLGIERPIRDWEVVTDVIAAWDTSATVNAILLKKYGYRSTIVPKSIVGRFPKIQGYLYIEVRPKKWQKKFFLLREGHIYYYEKSNTETLLCRLSGFDVFTLSRDKKKTPTQFCFALRSTSNISIFENKVDYVRFLCVDRQDRLYDWVLAIRLAKNELTYQEFPELFDEYESVPVRDRNKDSKEAAKLAADSTKKRHQNVIGGGAGGGPVAPPAFAPVSNTLLGRSLSTKDRPTLATKPVEEKILEPAPHSATIATMTHKPLLSFSNSAINYQERDRKSPKVASSKRRVEKEKARTEQLPQPRGRGVAETDRERYDREERDRLQMMDDLWEQEQAQMERLMDEERKRLAGGGAPEPDSAVDNEPRRRRDDGSKSSRERRNRSRAPAEDSRHRSDSARRKRPEDSSIKVSVAAMPSSSRREKERSGPERHVAGREREHDRAVGGDGGSRGGTLGRSKPKPLVDISGVSNCLTCGCSEFRSAHGARADTCTNCYHTHR